MSLQTVRKWLTCTVPKSGQLGCMLGGILNPVGTESLLEIIHRGEMSCCTQRPMKLWLHPPKLWCGLSLITVAGCAQGTESDVSWWINFFKIVTFYVYRRHSSPNRIWGVELCSWWLSRHWGVNHRSLSVHYEGENPWGCGHPVA